MRKTYFYLLLVFFLVFLGAGYYFSSTYIVPPMTQKIKETFLPANENQSSLLVVQVSDLTLSQPKLVSVWGLFISHNQPAQVLIKSIYPGLSQQPELESPATKFSLGRDKLPAGAFINEIKRNRFTFENVIVLDQTGIKTLAQWLSGKELTLAPIEPNSMEAAQNVLVQDAAAFNEICRGLALPERLQGEKPAWKEMIGNHFASAYPFDTFVQDWQAIASQAHPPQCEILATP